MKLTRDDIADLRAYERERDEFRARIIELRKQRRISVGPIVTMVFENRDTIRFQIQEMARAGKMLTDEAIQGALDVYNPLIPEPGTLSATLFIELTGQASLKEWLPKLVGIERTPLLRLHTGEEVEAEPEEGHAEQLTRDDATASVHYVRFELTPVHVDAFAAGPVVLAVEHPAYDREVHLTDAAKASLLEDLRGTP